MLNIFLSYLPISNVHWIPLRSDFFLYWQKFRSYIQFARLKYKLDISNTHGVTAEITIMIVCCTIYVDLGFIKFPRELLPRNCQ